MPAPWGDPIPPSTDRSPSPNSSGQLSEGEVPQAPQPNRKEILKGLDEAFSRRSSSPVPSETENLKELAPQSPKDSTEYQPFGRFTLPDSPPLGPPASPKTEISNDRSENSSPMTPPGFKEMQKSPEISRASVAQTPMTAQREQPQQASISDGSVYLLSRIS